MGWSREFIEKVRESTDLTDVARDYGDTKNAGPGKIKMNCPLPNHSEKTPSHYVQKEFFKCFGCGEGGDIFKFIQLLENCDFNESVQRLAGRAGLSPGPEDWIGGLAGQDKRKDLFAATEMASEIYINRLLDMDNKDAQKARSFLRERGITGAMCQTYGIGYSFPKTKGLTDGLIAGLKQPLTKYFKESGTKEVDIPKKIESTLKRAGLASEYQDKTTDFFFSERIMFTIFDSTNRPIAFSGRQLPGGKDPKYRNSPETEIYKKNEILYGLNWAKKHIAKEDRIIICEGQLDVIALLESSLPVAVGPCGTAMTENHVKKLTGYTKNFVLSFDSDAAGQNAAEKFSQWEEKHNLQIKAATLSSGDDPGDYLAQSKLDDLVQQLEKADPFLRWRINRIIHLGKVETIEERVLVANSALQIVKDHHEAMYHDDYVRYIGEKLDLPYTGLRQKFDETSKTPQQKAFQGNQLPPQNTRPPSPIVENQRKTESKETKISTTLGNRVLAVLLHNRQTLEQGEILPNKLKAIFFPTKAQGNVFEALLNSQNVEQAIEQVDQSSEEAQILQELRNSKPNESLTAEIVSKQVGELLIRRIKNELDLLHQEAKATNNLELITGIGDEKTAIKTMEDDGYDLFSSEADFLIEWLHERLEK